MLTDAELVERSRRRDAQAFGELVERHHKLVFGVAFARCRDTSLAEDLAQEAFVVAWTDLERLRDGARVGPWIAGIARNLATSAVRQRARVAELPELADTRTPEDEALDREDRELLQRALEDVPEAHREALVLYYVEGQSIARIAEALEIREELVKQRLTRGRNALRENVAARVDAALRRVRPSAGFGAGVVALIATLGPADAVAATSAAGKVISIVMTKKVGVIALATLALAAGGAAFANRRRAPVAPSRPPEPAARQLPARAAAPAAPSPAIAPATAPLDDDELTRIVKRSATPAAASVRTVQGNYELHMVDGYSVVHLGAGAPTTRPLGARGTAPMRTLGGRVIAPDGTPVPNAIVLADRGFNIIAGQDLMTLASAVTDGAGAFRIEAPATEAHALAIVREDWSEIVEARGDQLELRMLGHGALAARFTYDGEAETFAVHAARHGSPFVGRWKTARDGRLAVPSLPPGKYTITVGLAQAVMGGVSQTSSREVTIVDGKTTDLEVALAAGTSVVLTARWPAAGKPRGITYWLFTGSAPRDGADARARKVAESAPSLSKGGGGKDAPAEFHDVAPGVYYACAAFFDVATMNALDRPFGCTQLRLDAADSAREAEIVLR